MTKINHTEGPWHRNIKPASKYNTIFAGRNTHVARLVTDGLSEEEIEANCNLITAAPNMLDALEMSLKAHKIMRDIFEEHGGDLLFFDHLIGLMEHIIKKAKGEV